MQEVSSSRCERWKVEGLWSWEIRILLTFALDTQRQERSNSTMQRATQGKKKTQKGKTLSLFSIISI